LSPGLRGKSARAVLRVKRGEKKCGPRKNDVSSEEDMITEALKQGL